MSLPDFIGIGAQRAGSSWLAEVLAGHPDICMPTKEIHYFDRNYDKGIDWYRARFQRCGNDALVTGEFTPRYMFDERAASRLTRDCPKAKLICVLRDPVERLVSHYKWARHKKAFRGTIEEFIEEYDVALSRGLYFKQLQKFKDYYRSGNLLVLISEEIQKDFTSACSRLGDFLEVDASGFAKKSAHNVSMVPRFPYFRKKIYDLGAGLNSRHLEWARRLAVGYCMPIVRPLLDKEGDMEELPPELVHEMVDFFRDDLLQLEGYIGRNLAVWKTRRRIA